MKKQSYIKKKRIAVPKNDHIYLMIHKLELYKSKQTSTWLNSIANSLLTYE